MYVNIGLFDLFIICVILCVDVELKQVFLNLIFIYDFEIIFDDLLLEVVKNICECSKLYIVNGLVYDKIFIKGGYGIVSCYNLLLLVGGGSMLVCFNLKVIVECSELLDDFFMCILLYYCQQQIVIIDVWCEFFY